jgi:NADH-quinone oxidoreductase subunit M
MIFGLPVISVTIWLPIIFGVLVLATGNDKNAPLARILALVGGVLGFLVTLPLYTGFDITTSNMQFEEMHNWINRFNIHYHLGVDGISVLFILLNSFFTPLIVLAGWKVIEKRVAQYMAAFLIMSGIVNGVFAALDSILFYVFWEAMLIPMFIIIGVWGGPNRVYAAMKFFLYTLLGSLLMLVSLIYLYNLSGGSFEILDFHQVMIPMQAQILIFIAFFFAFAVKVPMFPVHTWLPDAHVEAPTGGSVVLAAIMLKVGAYGFLRFSMPITPDASHKLAGVMIALSLIAIVYIGLVALKQSDMKKLFDLAHGFRHAGLLHIQRLRYRRRADANGVARLRGRRAVPVYRCVV